MAAHGVSMYRLQAMLGDGQDSRRQALIAASTLVGALALSRAVDDETLSKEILSSVREISDTSTRAHAVSGNNRTMRTGAIAPARFNADRYPSS